VETLQVFVSSVPELDWYED